MRVYSRSTDQLFVPLCYHEASPLQSPNSHTRTAVETAAYRPAFAGNLAQCRGNRLA
jgi:hypothetical protein